MTNGPVLYQQHHSIVTLTLNRPESLNAMNEAMMGELERILIELEAWNVVTSLNHNQAANHGEERKPTDERYDRAHEFMEVCRKLWDSWEPEAVVLDREAGIFADPAKVHRIGGVQDPVRHPADPGPDLVGGRSGASRAVAQCVERETRRRSRCERAFRNMARGTNVRPPPAPSRSG